MNNWISVNNRLPEKEKMVLAWTSKGTAMVFRNQSGDWDTFECERINFTHYMQNEDALKDITHWQPLPKPPEQ